MSGESDAHVLLAAEHESLARRLRAGAERHVKLSHVRSAAEARAILFSDEPVDALLLEVHLADGDGLDVLEEVRPRRPHLPVLVVTVVGSVEVVNRAYALRCHFVRKTDTPDQIIDCVMWFVSNETRIPRLIRRATERWIEEHELPSATARLLRRYMLGVERSDLAPVLGISENTVAWHITKILAGKFMSLSELRKEILAAIDRELERADPGGDP